MRHHSPGILSAVLCLSVVSAGAWAQQPATAKSVAPAGAAPAAAAAEPVRDPFFWLGEMNKATAVINTEQGLLDQALGARLAAGVAKVIDEGNQPGALIRMHGGNVVIRDLANATLGLHRAADDFVVDVGNIAYIVDRQTTGAQPALHDIESDQHARVAQMTIVVNGHATDIHAYLARLSRLERFFRTR